MDILFFIILGLSLIAIVVFIAMAAFQFVKKDRVKGKKQLRNTGVSAIITVASLAMFIATMEPTEDTDKDEVITKTADNAKKEEEKPKETQEEREARSKKEAEEKLANEVPVWKNKVKEITSMDGTPTDKYYTVMLYAKDYPVTEDEIKEFEKYIVTEYQNKNYIADINNAEYMISNIFRANVINHFYGDVKSPINDFAFDFYQNTKYTYRGADSPDSDAVKANEVQMDKALIKTQ
ncbi:MAG: hypothetical protein RR602_11100 [Longicatena sp.]